MLNLLLAIGLILVSGALLAYLMFVLWGAMRGPLGGLFDQQRLDRYVARLRKGEEYLHAGNREAALAEFGAAFYPYLPHTQDFAATVAHHHTGLLSRLIAAADELQDHRVRLMSLAKVDRLFNERNVVQRRYVVARLNNDRAKTRDLERELQHNTHELRAALASLIEEIAAQEQRVRYH